MKNMFLLFKACLSSGPATAASSKKWAMLLMVTTLFLPQAFAQRPCSLVLVPEGDNICVLESNNNDMSVVRACRGNTICYTAKCTGAVSYQWSVTGGTANVLPDRSRCSVTWGEGSVGFVSVTVLLGDSVTTCTSTIQAELIDRPEIGCVSVPNYVVNVANPSERSIEVCVGDTISFIDNSTSSSTPIIDYYWEYPWGISANATCSFVARDPGIYDILHRVYNDCGCYDEEIIKLVVNEKCPVRLSCYGTVCAYTRESYTIDSPECSDYVWAVDGGTIVSPQHNNTVTVQWRAPSSGYGTLYLDGGSCNCDCKSRKSIRVPIISDNVPISGPDTLCVGEYYDFSVPLWGSTQYDWNISPSIPGAYAEIRHNHLIFRSSERGAYTITVTYDCAFLGCGPNTVTKDIVVQSPLSVSSSPMDEEVCVGSQVTFSTNTLLASEWSVLRNDTLIHSQVSSRFAYTFDSSGTYTVLAQNQMFCDHAMGTVKVQPPPPVPAAITGPDTLCHGFTAQYSATPTSPDYYILWEWTSNNTAHSYSGNSVNIAFDSSAPDIHVYQVDRKTECRSDTAVFRVSPFRLSPFPYDTVRLCQGQSILLDRLRDQSDNDVLYEWKSLSPAELSFQGSHLNADINLLANYTNDNVHSAWLTLTRNYCGLKAFDTVTVRIGEIDPPQIVYATVCQGGSTSFSVRNPEEADTSACVWYIDQDTSSATVGMPAILTFGSSGSHTVHLRYVSKYGCAVDVSDTVTVCPALPSMYLDAQGNTLSVVVNGNSTGLTYLWMNGATTPSTIDTSSHYYCIVTNACGCSNRLVHNSNSAECEEDTTAHFNINKLCYNAISITNLQGNGIQYPLNVTLTQGSYIQSYTIANASQPMYVPHTGPFSVKVS